MVPVSAPARCLTPPACAAGLAPRTPRRHARLPGLPSTKLGLASMTGALDDFGFEDYLGLPGDSPDPQPDLHSQMEARLGMGSGAVSTKPTARGVF